MRGILKFPPDPAMKKSDRIEAFVENLGPSAGERADLDRHYLGYFQCFNEGLYYEAHDVLEHLWLKEKDTGNPDADFFKGLIQLAGAFVHLKKQYERPDHPKDGRRLRPATRLFRLAIGNLTPYGPHHLALDVPALVAFCEAKIAAIAGSEFAVNPWHPDRKPSLSLLPP